MPIITIFLYVPGPHSNSLSCVPPNVPISHLRAVGVFTLLCTYCPLCSLIKHLNLKYRGLIVIKCRRRDCLIFWSIRFRKIRGILLKIRNLCLLADPIRANRLLLMESLGKKLQEYRGLEVQRGKCTFIKVELGLRRFFLLTRQVMDMLI